MAKLNKKSKAFLKRFLICLIVYSLFVGTIMIALGSTIVSANSVVKIIVASAIVILFIALILVVEISSRRKER